MENTKVKGETSFKTRIVEVAISCAKIYKKNFVEYDYLVCSEAFETNKCVEIKAESNNYLHLLGVNTNLSPEKFFQKCINGTLKENDFDFIKKGQSEKSIKGSVRQKIKALPKMVNMFDKQLLAEENFQKNKISCTFATADNDFTIGFIETGRPKSLVRKNQLDKTKCKPVELILRKKREEKIYSEIIIGDKNAYVKYQKFLYKHETL